MPPEIQLCGSGLGQYGSGSNLGTPPAAAAALWNNAGKMRADASAIAPAVVSVLMRDDRIRTSGSDATGKWTLLSRSLNRC